MLGTIIAGIIWAWKVVFNSVPMGVAVKSVLPFLWWWNIVWAVVIAAIFVLLVLATLAGTFIAEGGKRAGFFLAFLSSPLWGGLMLLSSALALSGIYLVDLNMRVSAESVEIYNQNHFIVGCVLYGLSLLMSLSSRSSSSSSK